MSRFLVIEKGYLLSDWDLKSKYKLRYAKPKIDRMYLENWVLVQPAKMLDKKYREKYQSLYNEVYSLSAGLKDYHIFISVEITPLQDKRVVGSILDNESLINEVYSHFQTKQKEKTVRRASSPEIEKRPRIERAKQ